MLKSLGYIIIIDFDGLIHAYDVCQADHPTAQVTHQKDQPEQVLLNNFSLSFVNTLLLSLLLKNFDQVFNFQNPLLQLLLKIFNNWRLVNLLRLGWGGCSLKISLHLISYVLSLVKVLGLSVFSHGEIYFVEDVGLQVEHETQQAHGIQLVLLSHVELVRQALILEG